MTSYTKLAAALGNIWCIEGSALDHLCRKAVRSDDKTLQRRACANREIEVTLHFRGNSAANTRTPGRNATFRSGRSYGCMSVASAFGTRPVLR